GGEGEGPTGRRRALAPPPGAPPRGGARPVGRRSRARRGPADQGEPGRAPARHATDAASVLHLLLAGTLRRDAGADPICAARPRRGRLHARLPRLRPRGEPALRRGPAPGRAGPRPEPESGG